jgi:hypothetical protein
MKDRGAEIGKIERINGSNYFVTNKGGTLTKLGKIGIIDMFLFAIRRDVKQYEVMDARRRYAKKHGGF